MVSTVTDRHMGMMGVTYPTVTPSTVPTMPSVPGMMVVPRGVMKFEKCTGGVKIYCVCEDALSISMVQNLCTMLQGGMVGCCVTMNGQTVCTCNFCCCNCTWEKTTNGVCFTCISGDANCCTMVQCCADCVCTCCMPGCVCCLTIAGTPICCGTCEVVKKK